MDRTTLTRNLRPLENQGLLRIMPGEDDAREREVTLMQPGHEILARAFPLWKNAQQQVKKDLGQSRTDRLLHDLSATVEIVQGK